MSTRQQRHGVEHRSTAKFSDLITEQYPMATRGAATKLQRPSSGGLRRTDSTVFYAGSEKSRRLSVPSLLRVDDLTVRYRSSDRGQLVALEGVTCDVGVGEAVGLLGESGCGKTTLGLALLGLLPTAGNIIRGSAIFGGRNLLTLRERELRKVRGAGISMVHQEPGTALNPVLRVGEQVGEVLRAHRCLSRE